MSAALTASRGHRSLHATICGTGALRLVKASDRRQKRPMEGRRKGEYSAMALSIRDCLRTIPQMCALGVVEGVLNVLPANFSMLR